MMKRSSSLSRSNDGKRNSRWSSRRRWVQGDAGYLLLPDSDGPGNGDHVPLSRYREELCLERQLQPNDTLQSLALEFNCSTAELKRVNRILKDNEIFALRVVKIPARCYSLLTESLPSVHNATCTSEGSVGTTQDVSVDLHAPIAQPRDLQAAGDASSVVALLNGNPEENGLLPPYETDAEGHISYNGADCGISWLVLLVGILILGFVGPIVYVLLRYHNPDHLQDEFMIHQNVTVINQNVTLGTRSAAMPKYHKTLKYQV